MYLSACVLCINSLSHIQLLTNSLIHLSGCLTDQGLMELTNVPSDRIVPMKLDVTNVDNIRRVYNIVARLLPEDTGKIALISQERKPWPKTVP